MINTEHVTQDLRPPKKPTAKALGKYFRKVEIDYEDIIGSHDRSLSTRYTHYLALCRYRRARETGTRRKSR